MIKIVTKKDKIIFMGIKAAVVAVSFLAGAGLSCLVFILIGR